MNLCDRIKQRREELGLSLEEVGEKLGVHRSTVLRYESGGIKRIPPATIEKLARILKTTPEFLTGWEGEFDPEIKVLARKIQKLSQSNRELLRGIVDTMSGIADGEMKKR